MQFRPEYVEAIDAARWNYWFLISAAVPILLVVFSATRKTYHIACLLLPLSYLLSWIAFSCAIQHYWAAKMNNAVTDAELVDASADTAALFGPILVGGPVVLVYVSLVIAFAYGAKMVVMKRKPKP